MSIYEQVLAPPELRDIEARNGADYCAKMMHRIPDAPVVDRIDFILGRCRGKRVLNLGCASGTLHQRIREVAKDVTGIDQHEPADIVSDLDQAAHLHGIYDLVVIGELLEHLANPGNLLQAVRELRCTALITVPNAFSAPSAYWAKQGWEQVNTDHVSWYSWKTLKTLVERHGFTVDDFAWYNGKPLTAEGIIFVVR